MADVDIEYAMSFSEWNYLFGGRTYLYGHPKTSTGRVVVDITRWESCVYYLWWEYLRRSESYRLVCRGEIEPPSPMEKVYIDFGDVHGCDFVTWWCGKGRDLFTEPPSKRKIRIVRESDEQVDFQDKSRIILDVPLDKRAWRLDREFGSLIRLIQESRGYSVSGKTPGVKDGQRFAARPSDAMYPVRSNPVTNSLQTALKVWDIKTENPTAKLWEVGKLANLPDGVSKAKAKEFSEYMTPKQIDQERRKRLSTLASRYIKDAERRIYWVARGYFPRNDAIPK